MTTSCLIEKRCVPCEGGVDKLTSEALEQLHEQTPSWAIIDGHHLHKKFTFEDFAQALAFTNEVGRIAEEEFHHPEITLTWGVVELRIWTHAIDGLSENDFILAAKCDRP